MNPTVLKIYNTAAFFENVGSEVDFTKVDPFCSVGDDQLYMPFKNIIFQKSLTNSKQNEYEHQYIFITKLDSTRIKCFSLITSDGISPSNIVKTSDMVLFVEFIAKYEPWNKEGVGVLISIESGNIYWYVTKLGWAPVVKTDSFLIENSLKLITNGILEQLSIINDPNYFILEEKVTTRFKSGNKTKKKNTSIFRIHKPREIRNRYFKSTNVNVSEDCNSLKVGQERRGHWRHFKSDRYINMKGKRIWIDPYWAGPTTFVDSNDPNKRYIVRLDL